MLSYTKGLSLRGAVGRGTVANMYGKAVNGRTGQEAIGSAPAAPTLIPGCKSSERCERSLRLAYSATLSPMRAGKERKRQDQREPCPRLVIQRAEHNWDADF